MDSGVTQPSLFVDGAILLVTFGVDMVKLGDWMETYSQQETE